MNVTDSVAGLPGRCDLLVVGAGPAGLAAAATAAELGLSVLVADENPSPGGQIYRAVTTTPLKGEGVLDSDYWDGARLVERLSRSAATYAPRATVWSVAKMDGEGGDAVFEVGVSQAGAARLVEAREVILATGAQERPFPIPGWTLPGVMTAGAAQIALKSAGIVPDGKVVLAGCGPLLYLLAGQLHAAGADIVAVLDTTPRGNWAGALGAVPDFLLSPYLLKGLKLMRKARGSLRFVGGVTMLRAEGDTRVGAVTVERGGSTERIPCDVLLLHQGVVPGINMSSAVGCAHDWDDAQHCFVPRTDVWFASTVPGIAITGDGAGIGGARSAALRGEIATIGAAYRLGGLKQADRDRRADRLRLALARSMRGRRFLDLLYRPASQFMAPPDPATIACRCEEVTAGQIRQAVATLAVTGPNQMKSFLRCGMGPCQGRLCGSTVTELIAQERRVPPAEVGMYRLRPPVKPVTLAELANLPQDEAAIKAVVR